jgi:hypothetical protein
MTEHTDLFERSPAHWGEVIAYLSMDLTGPAWVSLGYTPDRPLAEIRADLRRMITGLRERAAESPDAPPDIREVVFRENAMGWDKTDLEALAELGLSFVADHADAPQASAWEIALGSFPDAFPRTVKAMGEDTVIADMVALRDAPLPKVEVPAKLSDWDLQLCARHGWNPLSEEGFPPADSIAICQRIRRASEMLTLAAREMSPAAQKILLEEAAALIEDYEVWMPGPLEPLHLSPGDAAL